jgi:predicted HTH transcriptional regulator
VANNITNLRSTHEMMPRIHNIPPRSGSTSPRVQETSIAALKSLDPEKQARREEQIFGYVKTNGGTTCCEVEEALGLLHQSASSSITRLRKAGHLVDTGKRRPTGSGRLAIVWGAVQ